jgi:hypothetical protein
MSSDFSYQKHQFPLGIVLTLNFYRKESLKTSNPAAALVKLIPMSNAAKPFYKSARGKSLISSKKRNGYAFLLDLLLTKFLKAIGIRRKLMTRIYARES